MTKILNWLFGACFRTLGRFLAIFLILALFLFIGSKLDIELPDWLNLKVNASTITSYDSTFSTSNRYYYSTSNTLQNNSLGVIGNVYNGKSYNFTFYLNTSSLTAQSTYDITINANSNDFTKNLNASSIYIKTSNSTDFTNSTNGISLISFTNTATSSKNSNKIVLRIYVNSLTSYTIIDIFNSNYSNITSVSNFGIKSLSIDQVDTSGNNEIIENDKNNTQNIINNNNQNTQDIIDNQNSLLGSKCENLFDKNLNVKIGNFVGFDLDKLEVNKTYTISTNLPVYTYKFSSSSVSTNQNIGPETWTNGIYQWTFTYTGHRYLYFNIANPFNANTFVSDISQLSNYNIMLVPGSSSSTYCEYGSSTSKLDNIDNGLNDVNNSINNTDTTGAESSASGFFDNFTTEDYGISSIITAPLRAINAMLSDTCVAPGATYKGQSFSLPCGSMLWNRPGGLDLKNFINIMYGGFLAYFVIRSLFLDIEKLKNPDSDKVEVQKL